MSESKNEYAKRIRERSHLKYFFGLIIRAWIGFQYWRAVRIARKRGATIGEGVSMPISLAKRMNSHVRIGNHVSISTNRFSVLLYDLSIGDNVIIGKNVKIQLGSHDIDSSTWDNIRKKGKLVIEDYVWLCPDSAILPGCQHIGRGAVVGANSVVVKDVEEMSVVSGWPAKELRKRQCVHDGIYVETLSGNDFKLYRKLRKSNS